MGTFGMRDLRDEDNFYENQSAVAQELHYENADGYANYDVTYADHSLEDTAVYNEEVVPAVASSPAHTQLGPSTSAPVKQLPAIPRVKVPPDATPPVKDLPATPIGKELPTTPTGKHLTPIPASCYPQSLRRRSRVTRSKICAWVWLLLALIVILALLAVGGYLYYQLNSKMNQFSSEMLQEHKQLEQELRNMHETMSKQNTKLNQQNETMIELMEEIRNGSTFIWKLQQRNACYKPKDNGFAEFSIQDQGLLRGVSLEHKSGYLTSNNKKPSLKSRWGTGKDLVTLITLHNNVVLFPDKREIDKDHGSYSLRDYDSKTSDFLTFIDLNHPVYRNNPLYVHPGRKLRIWYGMDLFNFHESDNEKEHCVDVYTSIV